MDEKERRFQEWYSAYAPGLRNFLFRWAGGQGLDDLVQETFLKVWRAMDDFDGRAHPRTWIYRIGHNVAMDRHRRGQMEVVTIASDAPEARFEPTPELSDLITKGTAHLSETFRSAFVLYYFNDLGVADIAAILEIPEGTVKTRLAAARERFTEFLRENGVDYEF